MIRLVSKLLALTAAFYAAIIGYFYMKQSTFVFPASHDALSDPVAVGPDFRQDKLVTSDGLELAAWYHPPRDHGPVILYFHGNAGTLVRRSDRFATFAKMGYGVFAPEYRGYATNPGKPSEVKLASDAVSAYGHLREKGVKSANIVVVGESLGTYLATYVAAHCPVGALTLDSPFTSVADVGAERFPFLPVRTLITDRMETQGLIGRVNAPLLVMYSVQDRTVPPSQAQQVFRSANGSKHLFVARRGGHSSVLENGGFDAMKNFIAALNP
ncbi:alpha/beta hydrolase [Candidatus Kirkpatrickella diaphorinae]|uniref:Alpha/beta hydrolase n=1 Tax=Candidatus Kirkpatrickella diaphorinae TaxID=2984322 RepID=A0ABY6GJI4_9PROT|nr:alpha/beta hydrolase [Candidatus Kirkpatrickella diaphorinae]UYH50923.1 alpha/beta hydrolase [Candidatus Kirkpatrickella diaphorinae]